MAELLRKQSDVIARRAKPDDKIAGSDFGRTKCAQRAGNRTLPVNQYLDVATFFKGLLRRYAPRNNGCARNDGILKWQ